MEADPLEIAREAVALAEKATKGPMRCVQDHDCTRDGRRGGAPMQEVCVGETRIARCTIYSTSADGELFAHAGTHYGTLARALLAKHAEVGRLREALMVLEDNAGDMAERAGSSADAAAFRCLVEIARAALAQEAGK